MAGASSRAPSTAVLLGTVWLLACPGADSGPPRQDCRLVVWAKPQWSGSGTMQVIGSWDDWSAPGVEMRDQGDGWQAAAIELPPGEHGYLVVEAGVGRIDEHNPLTTFRLDPGNSEAAVEVSRALIQDCELPAVSVEAVSQSGDTLAVEARFLAARSGEALDVASIEAPGLQIDAGKAADGSIALSAAGLSRGRHDFVLRAADEAGRSNEARISVFVDPIAPTWDDAILYQVVTDRFRGDGGAWLSAPETPASRAGGTLGGVEAAITEGWFEDLGVSALWLSPVYLNPDVDREGNDGRLYSSYHGYWVLDSRRVDPRIGGEEALRSLVA
ncbi:MAG: hypothetical protein KC431_03810, partial [Myxococcales bacterium]|nr:hypothetical protein [Myxococcales bacterium]